MEHLSSYDHYLHGLFPALLSWHVNQVLVEMTALGCLPALRWHAVQRLMACLRLLREAVVLQSKTPSEPWGHTWHGGLNTGSDYFPEDKRGSHAEVRWEAAEPIPSWDCFITMSSLPKLLLPSFVALNHRSFRMFF